MAPNKHIVLLPFLAHGHFSRFLGLATFISKRYPALILSIVTTPLNAQHLRSKLPPDSDNIHLKSIPFNSSDHGLPPASENTSSLSEPQIRALIQATETLEPQFRRAVDDLTRAHGQPPLCIISDVLSWAVDVALSLNIPHASFLPGAYGWAVALASFLQLPHLRDGSPEFEVPGSSETVRLQQGEVDADPWTVFIRRSMSRMLHRFNMIICNTAEELEPKGIQLLSAFTGGRKIWTMGPLLQPSAKKLPTEELRHFIQWLDSRPDNSVIYVSFGSENSISAPLMIELALGLEASGKPFIWVVRPPLGFNAAEEFKAEWLPEGFEARMRDTKQGLVVKKWAPQVEILSHRAVGAFLSHCGWNSVMESLSRGVPIIGWPLAADQFSNSKELVEELGVCVEVATGVNAVDAQGNRVSSEGIKRAIDVVTGEGEKAKELKAKAMECSRVLRDAMKEEGQVKGSSIRALEEFMEKLDEQNVGVAASPSS